MIFTLPYSSWLPLLAMIICVAFSLSLVAGNPLAFAPEELELKHRCSIELADTINFICKGRTKSLADVYPQSFGQRNKRSNSDEIFYRPLHIGPIHECCLNICGYKELVQYCAPD